MHSTPSHLSQRVGKGKQREVDDVHGDGLRRFRPPVSPPTSPIRYPPNIDIDVKMEVLDLLEENDATLQQEDISNRDVDIEMAEETYNVFEEMEDAQIIEPFDWKTEVQLNSTHFSIMLTIALFS